MDCPYAALGLSRGAGADEIKQAYRKLVVETHPDKHATAPPAQQAAAAARFKTIQEAYQLLSDDRKRSAYEASRSGYGGAPFGRSHAGVNPDWSSARYGGDQTSGYTSRIGRWEFLKRYARDGMKGLDQPLHMALLALFVGGVVLFDSAHNVLWHQRNKERTFEAAIQASRGRSAAAATQKGSGGGGDDGVGGGGVNEAQDQPQRSAWLDGMRGRDVGRNETEQQQQQQQHEEGGRERQESTANQPVDRGGYIRASPPGQMAGHR